MNEQAVSVATARQDGSSAAPALWVVVPCYNEEEVLPETARRLTAKMSRLMGENRIDARSKVLLVNDGSRDATDRKSVV